jgi:hypothetical protein
MQTFIKLMHWMPTRVASVFGGLWVVIYAADLSPVYAFLVAPLRYRVACRGHRRYFSDGTRRRRCPCQVGASEERAA